MFDIKCNKPYEQIAMHRFRGNHAGSEISEGDGGRGKGRSEGRRGMRERIGGWVAEWSGGLVAAWLEGRVGEHCEGV